MKNLLRTCKSELAELLFKLFCLYVDHHRIVDNIIFECENDYADNPWAYYNYLIKNDFNKNHKLIWLVNNPERCIELNKNIRNVVFVNRKNKKLANRMRFYYYMNTSKWIIQSHPYWIKNWKANQFIINTTHSVAQLKAPGKPSHKYCDYVLSCSKYCTKIKKQTFGEDVTYLELGMPRLDLMYNADPKILNSLPNYHGQKLIVSMETFKYSQHMHDSDSTNPFCLNVIKSEKELLELDQFLTDNELLLLVKIHHLQDLSRVRIAKMNSIVYFTDNDLLLMNLQINQLLAVSTLLLTDYSSVFYDYLIVDRPIGFMIADIKNYTRGFIVDKPLQYMPGRIINSFDELLQFLMDSINDIDIEKKQREIVKDEVFQFNDAKNCERLYKWMFGEKRV